MRFGLFGINFGPCADPTIQLRVARRGRGGLRSVWTGEHVVCRPRKPGRLRRRRHSSTAVVALTRVAAATERLRLGTGILVLPHHNPVLLAKALASLDVVLRAAADAGFRGRLRPSRVPRHRRSASTAAARSTDDHLGAIRALWTEEVPRFAGRFAAFAEVRFEPKPVQRPHPPILIGGQAPPALARARARRRRLVRLRAHGPHRPRDIVRELRRLRDEMGRGTCPSRSH